MTTLLSRFTEQAQQVLRAEVVSSSRIFWLSGLALLASLPLLVLVRDAGGGSGGAVHME